MQTTTDQLLWGALTLLQPQEKAGLRVNVDTILLASYARIKSKDRVLEFGSAHGAVSLIMAKRRQLSGQKAHFPIIGVDILPELVELAWQNVALNQLEGFVSFSQMDLREHRHFYPPQCFDVVLMNPPYDEVGRSRTSASLPLATALHGAQCSLKEVVQAATYLLKNKGRLYLVIRAKRMGELFALLAEQSTPVKRIRCVHARKNSQAYAVLVEAVRAAGKELVVDPPLYVHGEGNTYAPELIQAYQDAIREE